MPESLPRDKNIIIEDASLARGFTVIPNLVLRRPGLSPGAKLAYVMLLSYAWQDDDCFPGQETLARDMGVTDRSVRTYLKELQQHGLITIKQRGLNRTNLYILHRLGTENGSAPGPESISDQGRKEPSSLDRKPLPTTKTQDTNTQKTIGVLNGSINDTPAPDPLEIIRAMSPEERLILFEQKQAELRRLPALGRSGSR